MLSTLLQSRTSALHLGLVLVSACSACRAPDPGPRAPDESARSPAAVPLAAPVEAQPSEWTIIPQGDPTKAEISFAAGSGWQGTLVLDNGGVGVWTVAVMKVFQAYGCPEIVGLDDKGRCHILWSYSGKWSPVTTVADGTWLGGLARGDVDPRVRGPEVYVGAQSGNIYEVVGYPDRIVDNRRIARLPGSEIHTLLAGELDSTSPGPELIAFTLPGAIYELKPKPADQDGFDVRLLEPMDGRVREAQVLPTAPGHHVEIAVIMRTGALEILTFTTSGPKFTPVLEIGMGMGRLAINLDAPAERPVIYCVADDGRVFRNERTNEGQWKSDLVYVGPQGMRGCVWGHFDADHGVETIAVHGYSHRVEVLTRRGDTWRREVIFADKDKGHWLTAGELDGRNTTDEIVCSGYSGRVVLLARPPGFGMGNVLATPALPARH